MREFTDTTDHRAGHRRPDVPEPIAVVGAGCRMPGGVHSPRQLWEFLHSGRDALGTVPAERWAAYRSRGGEHARAVDRAIGSGGFLDDIAGFDAEFFGISPREAELMDPQQRVTLEVAWEALEHAGIPATELAASGTGVFMGVCTDDYGRRTLEDLPRIEAWSGIGASLCGIPNRVSHALDLRGPSVAVDTACSASLVALHQACQSLRGGETDLALAGGVMLMASPAYALSLGAAGALAPDGRSKTFDASADGYGRSEGCAILVLKRLGDVDQERDHVLGLVRGSAVRQDGRTNGIMAPRRDAQEDVLRQACRNAGIEPATVGYVEAHGTGTSLGDPIEAGALAAVVGAGRDPSGPCLVGSVKSRIGHLEAASGIASVITVLQAFAHERLPATPLPTGPRPEIPWSESGLRVVTEPTPWPACAHRPRRAGIANYGYGGTLADVILEEPPAPAARGTVPRARSGGAPALYPLSAATPAGIRANAERLADWLDARPDVAPESVGHTLAHRRSALNHRATVLAGDRAELTDRLRALAATGRAPATVSGTVTRAPTPGNPVWVFSGHGSQWVGMGQGLLAEEPALGAVLDELEPVYQTEMGFSPRKALLDGDLAGTDRAQAMIFAIQIGLARVWAGYGLRPAAVIGHSVGEIAAAVVAGTLDLADAARLVCRRSVLLRRAAGRGAMAMVNLPFAEVAERLRDHGDVGPAIVASPTSTVISGRDHVVGAVCAAWESEGLAVRRVDTDVAFHSPDMDDLLTDLRAAAADIVPQPLCVPLYSTAVPHPRVTPPRDADYWVANLRNPVHFATAVEAAAADGHRVFLEVSAHPVVAHSVQETLTHLGVSDGVTVATLRRNRPERATFLLNLAQLHCHGASLDWSRLHPHGRLADLPTMAWQHRPYWVEGDTGPAGGGPEHDPRGHTLLGARTAVHGTTGVTLWQTRLDHTSRPYPGEHAVLGSEIVPAAVVLTTFLAAGAQPALRDVVLRAPLPTAAARDLQVVRDGDALHLGSRLAARSDQQTWLAHATASCHAVPDGAGGSARIVPGDGDALGERLDPAAVAERLVAIGVDGLGFPWRVTRLHRAGDALVATVVADPDDVMPEATWGSLFDAALSTAPVLFPGGPLLRMPGRLRRVTVHGPPPAEARVGVRLVSGRVGAGTEVDIEICAPDGTVRARLAGVRFEVVDHRPAEAAPDPASAGEVEVAGWRGLEGAELRSRLVEVARELVADELRTATDQVDVHRPLVDLGVDSMLSAAIRTRLEGRLRLRNRLPGTLLWDHPTVGDVAEFLATAAGDDRL